MSSGLRNVDLNCYMNAALQALSGSSKFVEEIESLADENGELRKLSLFTNLLNSLNDTAESSIVASDNDLFENWTKSGMQDAFEVMSFMLNEVIKEYKGKHKNDKTFQLNFPMVFKLTYRTECTLKHSLRTPIQTDLALHVPIPEKGGNITITDVLNEVVEGESISEYSCDTEGCRSKTGKKYIKLVEVPNILCIHIQRNQLTAWGGMTKNYAKITLESDTLELSRTLLENTICLPKYKLCSVIEHRGSLNSGHYVCYKRLNNKWYCANDSSVREVQFETIKHCDMYILMYEQEEEFQDEPMKCTDKHRKNTNKIIQMLLSCEGLMVSLEEICSLEKGGNMKEMKKLFNVLNKFKGNNENNEFYSKKEDCLDAFIDIMEPAIKEWYGMINTNTNKLHVRKKIENLFKFNYTKTCLCPDAHVNSYKSIASYYISLPVPKSSSDDRKTLSEFISNLFEFPATNNSKCSAIGCNKTTQHVSIDIENMPNILVIRLKREFKPPTYFKLEKELNLKLKGTEYRYKLCFMILTNESGHFIGFRPSWNEWVCITDNNRIMEVCDEEICDIEPELLIFEINK